MFAHLRWSHQYVQAGVRYPRVHANLQELVVSVTIYFYHLPDSYITWHSFKLNFDSQVESD